MMSDVARDFLDRHQISIYFASVLLGVAVSWAWPGSGALEPWINPTLAFMLFVTFLQVPLARLGRAFTQVRFLSALSFANFVAVPLLVAALIQFLPAEPLLLLGVLFVLLTPCVDYVVTFSHLGRGDATSLLAATPILLIAQMALLPLYLGVLATPEAAALVSPEPFLHAFAIIIAAPLLLAALAQWLAASNRTAQAIVSGLAVLPVPATAVVLFVVVCAVVPQLAPAIDSVVRALPIYLAFAVLAPLLGWLVGRGFSLPAGQTRAMAFSAATRNSLVILPLGLAVPDALPIVPAVIVTQTLIELASQLVYIRVIPKLIA